jgi:benzoyl-CoA 2,3-dioxygenase component B
MGLARWNRSIATAGVAVELKLPSPRFRRAIGAWAGRPVDPSGRIVTQAEWNASRDRWLPSDADRAFIKSLMRLVTEPGKMAGWIAPPNRGIDGLPVEYEYVLLH